MSEVLTALLAVMAAGCLLHGFARRQNAYTFPFLCGLIVVSFVLPQLPGLMHAPFLPPGGYDKTVLMACLCLACALLGWRASRAPFATLRIGFDEGRLKIVATLFALIGAYFYYALSQLPGEQIVGVQISGAPVTYLFFGRLLTYSLAIASILYAWRPSRWMLAVILFDLVFYLDRILVTGKRAEAAELWLILALSLWFQRRWAMPRGALALILVGAVIGTTSMSDYRDVTRAHSGVVWNEIAQIDAEDNFARMLQEGGPELRNAILLISATDRTGQFDYGAFHWNQVIWNYLPSRIGGSEFKQALMFRTPKDPRDFNPLTGTTMTGMVDAFRSFWYAGALKFLLLAYVLRRMWNSAMEGQLLGQFLYMLSAVPAMHAFSHTTDWVVSAWTHMVFFCIPVFAWARVRPAARAAPPSAVLLLPASARVMP
ncbi:hypothetical protein [Oceaniglobus roseus]|uniref:hypothetical protein n=1 Tax=Oceaniglobus roseus TaxID=1737570 RepID=UPI001C12C7B9|nr:hypothetical protein [Kandeliimicrobium roseum]